MKFRKKPVVVEASQWFSSGDHPKVRPTSYMEIHKLLGTSGCSRNEPFWDYQAMGVIDTLEGQLVVIPGDWIITGIQGEVYPCKDGIFRMTYEPIAVSTGQPLNCQGCGGTIAQHNRLLQCRCSPTRYCTEWPACSPPCRLANNTTTRAEFEAWAKASLYNTRRDDDGEYTRLSTIGAWDAWQAALTPSPLAAVQSEPAPKFVGWYCAHCQRGVDSSEVTFHEQHQECGRVITNDRPPAAVSADARDAARYRWLRDNPWAPDLEHAIRHHQNNVWDKLIDTELAAKPTGDQK